jgi:hypothetical protein
MSRYYYCSDRNLQGIHMLPVKWYILKDGNLTLCSASPYTGLNIRPHRRLLSRDLPKLTDAECPAAVAMTSSENTIPDASLPVLYGKASG